MIKKTDTGYQVVSESGKSLGDFKTLNEAKSRLRQVEYFKNKKGSAGNLTEMIPKAPTTSPITNNIKSVASTALNLAPLASVLPWGRASNLGIATLNKYAPNVSKVIHNTAARFNPPV